MRDLTTVAALVAGYITSAHAASCTEIAGNYYCNPVNAVTFLNLGGTGSYNRVSSMSDATGACTFTPYAYSGTNAPFDEEVCIFSLVPRFKYSQSCSFQCISEAHWR